MKSPEKSVFLVRPPLAARIAVAAIFVSPSLLSFGALATGSTRGPEPVVPLLLTGFGCLILALAALRCSARVALSGTHVSMGFVPVWVTRIRRSQIHEIRWIAIDAYKEYNGWGIKGSAKTEAGRLYSAGGSHALRIRDTRGRTFLIAFPGDSELTGVLSSLLDVRTSEQGASPPK